MWATRTSDEQAVEDLLDGLAVIPTTDDTSQDATREVPVVVPGDRWLAVQREVLGRVLADLANAPGRHEVDSGTRPHDRASALLETRVIELSEILDVVDRGGVTR